LSIKRPCSVENCVLPIKAMGYCVKHYTQMKRHGKILEYTRFDSNQIIILEDFIEIIIFHKDKKYTAIVSMDKLELIKNHKWRVYKNYVLTTINNKNIYLHRLLLNIVDPNVKVDHINHNGLDNLNENIRVCTQRENLMNTSKRKENTSTVIGVVWDKERNKWRSQMRINGKVTNLGRYDKFKDAVKIRLEAEIKYFQEFAPQKNLFEEYGVGNK